MPPPCRPAPRAGAGGGRRHGLSLRGGGSLVGGRDGNPLRPRPQPPGDRLRTRHIRLPARRQPRVRRALRRERRLPPDRSQRSSRFNSRSAVTSSNAPVHDASRAHHWVLLLANGHHKEPTGAARAPCTQTRATTRCMGCETRDRYSFVHTLSAHQTLKTCSALLQRSLPLLPLVLNPLPAPLGVCTRSRCDLRCAARSTGLASSFRSFVRRPSDTPGRT